MNTINRLGRVLQAEWRTRFGGPDDEFADDASRDSFIKEARRELAEAEQQFATTSIGTFNAASAAFSPTLGKVPDVAAAYRILGLPTHAQLDEVRSAYRTLSQRYYPRVHDGNAEQRQTAHLLIHSLTTALYVLEEHLLPIAPTTGSFGDGKA